MNPGTSARRSPNKSHNPPSGDIRHRGGNSQTTPRNEFVIFFTNSLANCIGWAPGVNVECVASPANPALSAHSSDSTGNPFGSESRREVLWTVDDAHREALRVMCFGRPLRYSAPLWLDDGLARPPSFAPSCPCHPPHPPAPEYPAPCQQHPAASSWLAVAVESTPSPGNSPGTEPK